MPTRLLQPRPKNSVCVVDLDGVVADIFRTMNYQLGQRGINELMPMPNDYGFSDLEARWRNFALDCLGDPSFYAHMLPMLGAIPSLHLLSQRYGVCAMTARVSHFVGDPRKVDMVVRATRNWLYRYEIMPNDIVFSEHKVQKALDEYGREAVAFVVEDSPAHAASFAAAGITSYLVDYPYNRGVLPMDNLIRVDGLADVVEHRRRIGDMDAPPRLPSAQSADMGDLYDFYSERDRGDENGGDTTMDEHGPGRFV